MGPTTGHGATAGIPVQPADATTTAREGPRRPKRTAATHPSAVGTTTATPPSDQTYDVTSAAVQRRGAAANVGGPHYTASDVATIEEVFVKLCRGYVLTFRYYFRTYSQTISQNIPTYPTYSHNPQPYQYPTPIHSQWTTDVQQSASLTNTGNTGLGPVYQSFPHLKATYAQQQLVNDIGKFNSDNPKRLKQVAYANIRQNRSARRDLAGLHAA